MNWKKSLLLKCSEDLFNCVQLLLNQLDALSDEETRRVVAEWHEQHFAPTLENNDILQGLTMEESK